MSNTASSFQRRRMTSMYVGCTAAVMIGMAAAASADDRFSLAKAIPDDVFIASVQRHNPEREFLEEYWAEVWDTLKKTGVIEDGLELILSALDDEQREEVNRIKERFTELIAGGDWKALTSGQVAFGERLSPMPFGPKNIAMGPPDFVVMFRSTDSIAQKNFKAMSDILKAAVDEINTAANEDLKIEQTTRHKADLVSFNFTQKAPQAPRMPLTIGRLGDTVLLTFGAGICDDVVDLLAGKSSGKSIADSPRFKQAFAELGPAEDAIVFFDMKNLRRSLENIADGIFKAIESEIGDDIKNGRRNDDAMKLNAAGYAAYEAGKYNEALKLFEEAYAIDAGDSVILYNLACMHTLTGNRPEALSWLEKAVEAGFHAPNKIAEDDDLKSLRDDPRYQAALKTAQERAGGEKRMWATIARGIADRLLETLGVFDYSATIEHTDGYSTYSETLTMLSPNAEKNPIYPVFGNRKPITDFARYLPRETVSFSANSGIALDELYGFIEQLFNDAGQPGKEGWAAWQELQTQVGFDIHKDFLDWIDTATVSGTFQINGTDQWITMLKIKNEDAAREKLAFALKFTSEKIAELAATNPMMFALVPRVEPTDNDKLEGFHDVAFGMMPVPAVCGVRDGWLMIASSEDAALLCLETAAGTHDNVRQNKRLMAEALIPDGPVDMISFTDHRGVAKQIAQALTFLSMAGGFVGMVVPDPEAQKAIMKIFGIVSKLAPVAAKVDFYKSSASYIQSNGRVWRTHGVTHYFSPKERAPAETP
ncbi:MAG: tetratricopeptide repeat protein [Planctomycetes bacterium]|nr:tetratricopeptide repeat protein [Planctomycetota bacterium]